MLPAARRLCASALPRLGLAAPARGLKELNAESAALIEQAAKVAPAWQGILERVAADAKRMENEPPPPDQWLDTTRAVRYIIQTRGDRRRAFAVGKRKTSVARVYVEPVRDGQLPRIEVNGQLHLEYFPWPMSALSVSPLLLARRSGKYDVQATVRGGGLSGASRDAHTRVHCCRVSPAGRRRRPPRVRTQAKLRLCAMGLPPPFRA